MNRTRMISAHPHKRKYLYGTVLNENHTPYQQGKEAAAAGLPMQSCPYSMGRQLPARAAWLDGWQDVRAAQREARFEANARALGELPDSEAARVVTHRISARGGRVA